jgi:hypothetical protein
MGWVFVSVALGNDVSQFVIILDSGFVRINGQYCPLTNFETNKIGPGVLLAMHNAATINKVFLLRNGAASHCDHFVVTDHDSPTWDIQDLDLLRVIGANHKRVLYVAQGGPERWVVVGDDRFVCSERLPQGLDVEMQRFYGHQRLMRKQRQQEMKHWQRQYDITISPKKPLRTRPPCFSSQLVGRPQYANDYYENEYSTRWDPRTLTKCGLIATLFLPP